MTVAPEAQTDSRFASNVEELALEELSKLEEHRILLQGELAEVQGGIKSVKAVLQALRPSQVKRKKGPAKVTIQFAMGEEREAEMIRWLTGNEDEITSRSAREAFPGWGDSYINSSLKLLRETGVLRLSAQSGGLNIYRSLL